MGIRPSLTPVYEKDEHTGRQKLVGYKDSGPTASQKKKGVAPKKGFGINTDKQSKVIVKKETKIKNYEEKVAKRKGTKKTHGRD